MSAALAVPLREVPRGQRRAGCIYSPRGAHASAVLLGERCHHPARWDDPLPSPAPHQGAVRTAHPAARAGAAVRELDRLSAPPTPQPVPGVPLPSRGHGSQQAGVLKPGAQWASPRRIRQRLARRSPLAGSRVAAPCPRVPHCLPARGASLCPRVTTATSAHLKCWKHHPPFLALP